MPYTPDATNLSEPIAGRPAGSAAAEFRAIKAAIAGFTGVGLFITPQQYGAVGDGVTDDTVAIQTAITFVHSNGGGVVYCKAGSYKYTTALDMTEFTYPVMVQGAGKATLFKPNLATVGIDCTGSSDLRFQDFQLVPVTTEPVAGFLFAPTAGAECLRNKLINITTEGGFTKAAVYNYRSEEFTMLDCYIRNQTNGACAYWDTSDNDGVGEDITSPHATIANGTGSNTTKRFYGTTFHVDGTGNTDCVRMRGMVDWSMDGTFFVPVNTTGRSVVYIDQSTAAISSNRGSLTNFRSEGGRKPANGIHIAGTTSLGVLTVCNGYMDVATNLLYAAAAGSVYNLEWKNITGDTGTAINLNQLENSDVDFAIATIAQLNGSQISCHSTSIITASDSKNFIKYYDTGVYVFENLRIDVKSGNSVVTFYSNGTKKWTFGNIPSGHEFQLYNASDQLKLEINQTGNVKIPNLAGAGSRPVVADLNGVLSAP